MKPVSHQSSMLSLPPAHRRSSLLDAVAAKKVKLLILRTAGDRENRL